MTSLAGRVLATIRRRALFEGGAKVLAAVSGGSDSVALAYLLAELSAAGVLKLVGLAHLDHCLRPTSDRDAEFCRRVAADVGASFDLGRCDVGELAARRGRSLEEAAREARYDFLEGARARLGADVVAVGHTRDDQAETVLLRLSGGAGPRGLAAIYPRRDRVVRPLIDQRRDDLVAYLEAHGRPWVDDETNLDRSRRRNRIRHDVLPHLIHAEGSSVVDALARSADIARADDALLAALTDDAVRRVASEQGLDVALDVAGLAGEPLALRRRIVYWALQRVARRAPTFEHVESVLRLLERSRPGVLALPGSRVELSPGVRVLFSRGHPTNIPDTFASWGYDLTVPGEVAVPEAGVCLRAQVGEDGGLRPPRGFGGAVARFDRPALGPALVVRAWQPGDRLRLQGLTGRKKVQDLFVDGKVRRADRHRVPIVAAPDGRIVWVAGHAVSAEFGVTGATKSVVVLSFEPLGGL